MRSFSVRSVTALCLASLALGACARKVDGPTPSVSAVTPATVCTEQRTTVLTVAGDGLSPLVRDGLTTGPRLELPQVTLVPEQSLDGSPFASAAISIPDDADHPDVSRVAWTSQQQMTVQIFPELALPPGLHALHVVNRNGHAADFASAVLAVPPPVLTRVEADLVCQDQANTLTLTGDFFLKLGDLQPDVAVGPKHFAPAAMEDCRALPGPQGVQACRTLKVLVPSASLPSGTHVVVVTNPETAACASTATDVTVTFTPCPTLGAVVPDLVCTAQGDRAVTASGTGFLVVDARTPTLTLGTEALATTASDCTPLTGLGLREVVQSCHTLSATVKQGTLAPTSTGSTFAASVTNPTPANCTTKETVSFVTVPAPVVTSVVPDLVCSAEGGVDLIVSGSGFLTIQSPTDLVGSVPTVLVAGLTLTARGLSGCTPVAGPLETVASCTALTVTLPQGVSPAAYPVTVANPTPAGCTSNADVTLAVAAPPAITAVTPDVGTAAEGPLTVTLTGTGFLQVGAALPTVSLEGAPLVPTTLTGCTAVAGTTSGAQTCTTLTFVVPQGAPTGEATVAVTNPAPAPCTSALAHLFLAPAPTLTRLVPPGVCSVGTGAQTIGVEGTDFFRVAGAAVPQVTIGARTYAPTMTAASCVAIAGYSVAFERCTAMTVQVPASDFANGTFDTTVTNPAPVAAHSTPAVPFSVTVPPTLLGVTPAKLCSGGGALTLTGTNFTPGMRVELESPTPQVAASVVTTSSTSATATFAGPLPVGGPYDVKVVTGAGACFASLTTQVTVTAGPVVFFMDPPVVYNGITTQATVYASGFSATGLQVSLRLHGSGTPQVLVSQYSPAKANRILVTVPPGLAPGSYDIVVTDSATTTCPGELLNAFKVVSQTTLTLTALDPPFGYTGATSAVTLTANPTAGGGLKALPRLYLNPSTAGALAIPLESVTVLDSGRATAVVPAGQAVGTYALIAVNPDGAVGVLPAAFKILPNPIPFIDVVSPALLVSQSTAAALTLTGGNLRAGAQVSLVCRDATGATVAAPPVTTGTVTATSATATVNTSSLPNGTACVVRVANTDGSYGDYSAIAITNPASKPSGFAAASALTRGRRALVASEGNVTRAAQFLFAIGGDDGAATPVASDTLEAAPLDIFGKPGSFAVGRAKLTVPRAFATGQRVGRWLYVAGGRSGATVHATVERAYLLDPQDRVGVTDVDYAVTAGTGGLPAGVYSYRVSAVMAAGDALNPGGENLPSDPFPVSVPALAGKQILLTLSWTATPGAASYRVYRSVAANDVAGTERLLAEIPATGTSYQDTGAVTPAGLTPLPIGSTGAWKVAATLPEAREGAGSAIAWDPDTATKANVRYLYVVGGRNAAGTVLSTIVRVPLTLDAGGGQTVGAPVVDARALGTARWQVGVLSANATTSTFAGAGQYLYVVGGLTGGAGTASSVNEVTQVGTGGALGVFATESSPSLKPAGFAGTIVNNLALVFGGKQGAADASGAQASLAAPAPAMGNWSSTSGQMSTARYLTAGALHGAFFFVLGGTTGTGADLTTELMTW